jgi:hypothetical protein
VLALKTPPNVIVSFEIADRNQMKSVIDFVKLRTQQALADLVGKHISQIRRYESGQSQPTLDAIRKLSVGVSADILLFGKDERGSDNDLRF